MRRIISHTTTTQARRLAAGTRRQATGLGFLQGASGAAAPDAFIFIATIIPSITKDLSGQKGMKSP
jgi:hypothetical protein